MLTGKSVDVQVSLPSDTEIAFVCRFNRDARLLFDAWTNPKHVKRWWGCEGANITQCAMDPQVGGHWSLVMRMADGSEHPFFGTYQEVVRPRRLVYTECYDKPEVGKPEWVSTVTFEEINGVTTLTHALRHKTREIRDAHLQSGMEGGVRQTWTRLDRHAAAMEETLASR